MNKQFLILLTFFTMTTYAQQVNLTEIGIKFTLPEGWVGQEQGEYMLVGHQTIPGLMVLFQNTSKTIEELQILALQGILDEGISLQPKGGFSIISEKRIEGYYEGDFQGVNATSFAIGLIDGKGNGMSILIVTETNKFNEVHISEAKKLASTVVFSKVGEKNIAFWKSRIIGRKLKYMNTSGGSDYSGGYSGISDVEIINLCTNGTFNYYSNSHVSFDSNAGSGHVRSNESNVGHYTIYSQGPKTYLDLTFNNGKVNQYLLTKNKDKNTLLNGSRYFLADLEGCE